jgi:hypothetical protein
MKSMKLIWALLFFILCLVSQAQTEVHVYLLEDCPMAQFYGPTFRELQNDSPETRWIFIFPNSNDSLAAQHYLQKHRLSSVGTILESASVPIWEMDQPFAVSPSVVVWNHQNMVYRGAIDDAFAAPGKRRMIYQKHFLKEAIANPKNVEKKSIQPVGCLLSLPQTH